MASAGRPASSLQEVEEIQVVETLQADAFQIAKVIVPPVQPARISLIVQADSEI